MFGLEFKMLHTLFISVQERRGSWQGLDAERAKKKEEDEEDDQED